MKLRSILCLAWVMGTVAMGCMEHPSSDDTLAQSREAIEQSSFAYRRTVTYQGGFQAELSFTNTTGAELHGWEIRLDYPISATVIAANPGTFSHFTDRGIDNRWIFSDPNAVVPPGGNVTVTISVRTTAGTGDFPTNCQLNGVQVTCDGSDNLIPPSAPGPITLTYVGPNIIEGHFGASTDNVGVVAYRISRYFRGASAPVEWFESASTSFRMADAAGEYILQVAAVDRAGNLSQVTSTESPVVTPPHPVRMVFKKTQVWEGGFNAQISLQNLSPDQVSNWTATFDLAGVNSVWGADWRRASYNDVTQYVSAPSYNPTIAGGAGGILLNINASGSAVPTSCSFYTRVPGTCELVIQ
ncbi:MAG: cellulose binding domain-containing protein [Polyangiaceae bacterium]